MRNKKLRLYLAHNLNDRKKIREFELELENQYSIDLFNPFYDCARDDINNIDKGVISRWNLNMSTCKNIVRRDLSHIDESDGILAIIIIPSIGTSLEIAYAYHKKKLIFIISEKYIDHPWIKVYSNHRFKNIDEFKDWLRKNQYSKSLYVQSYLSKLFVVIISYFNKVITWFKKLSKRFKK